MLSTNKIIRMTNGESKINSPIILYRGDKNIEAKFQIKNNPFMADSPIKYGQLIIELPEAGIVNFSTVNEFNDETVSFILPSEMMDEITEVGLYTLQLRLYNEDKTSVATLPEITQALDIREPIASEDTASTVVITYDAATKSLAVSDNLLSYDEKTKTIYIEGLIL